MPPFAADLEALQSGLAVAYRDAWTAVVTQQQRVAEGIALNPRLWRQRDRLAEVRRTIEAEMGKVDVMARHWVSREYPRFYAAGAQAAAEQLHNPFTWTQSHREAVALHARDTYDDLLEATRFVREDTKRFLREVVKETVVADQLVGRTAKQTARNVTKFLQGSGITSVIYKNGARHGLADYADMAIRTKTAVAYNIGTLNQGAEFGVKFYEVFDGPSCGWTSHDDTDLANGKIVDRGEAATATIAHPRCARSFGPRPDLVDKKMAQLAQPTAGGQGLPRPEAPGRPLEAAARTREAREAARARRAAAGLVANPRTPQAVLARRAAMLQKVRLPRAAGPGRPPPPEPTLPPAPQVPAGWKDELDGLLANRPATVVGRDATDQFGNPTAASYAQEAWTRQVGAVVDREALRRTDDFATRLAAELDADKLKAEWDALTVQRMALPGGWDEAAQKLFGKPWNELPTSTDRQAAINLLKSVEKERGKLRKLELAAEARYKGVADVRAIAYRQATREVMGEVRAMGDGATDTWRWMDPKLTGKKMGSSYGEAKKTLDAAGEFFPRDWIDRANAGRSIRTGVIQRGHQLDHARYGYTDVMLSKGRRGALLPDDPDMLSVATHELSHLMETVDPRVRTLEHAFHHRRTTDFTQTASDTVTDRITGQRIPGPPKQEATSRIYRGENGRKDQWAEHYMGKVYPSGTGIRADAYWEHLAMGMEGLWTGRYDMLLDDDYRAWVLGLLVSL